MDSEEGEGRERRRWRRRWMDWRFGADVDITGQLCTHCHALMGNIQGTILHFDMILVIN